MLENLAIALETVKTKDYKITLTKTEKEVIHQTQRNELGALLRTALAKDFLTLFPPTNSSANDVVAYLTADGTILEIPNKSIRDKITNADGSGAISVEISVSVKGLEYNAADASDAYQVDLADKAAKAQAKAEEKARKVTRDTAARAKKISGQ